MKKLFNPFMSLALFVVTFSSCSSFETVEEFKTSKSVSSNEIKAFEEYGKAIDDNFEAFLETRDIISRASSEKKCLEELCLISVGDGLQFLHMIVLGNFKIL